MVNNYQMNPNIKDTKPYQPKQKMRDTKMANQKQDAKLKGKFKQMILRWLFEPTMLAQFVKLYQQKG